MDLDPHKRQFVELKYDNTADNRDCLIVRQSLILYDGHDPSLG